MIKIEALGRATLSSEGVTIIKKASPLEEHQICELLLKELYRRGFYAEISTDAKVI